MDLVVGRAGSTDAQDLLSAFDINLCKSYYDGTTLHVHDPHLTFASKSMVHEPRATVIEAYLGFVQNSTDESGNKIYSGFIERPYNDFAHNCTYAGPSDVCEAVSLEQWTAAAIESPDSVPQHHRRRLGSKEYHNFVCRMVHRLHKYAERGIEFVNCPAGALESKIQMDHYEGDYR